MKHHLQLILSAKERSCLPQLFLYPLKQVTASTTFYFCARKKSIVVLSYTIANEEIRLNEKNSHSNIYDLNNYNLLQYPGPLHVRTKRACSREVSVLNVDGRMLVETDINYHPSQEIGVVATIQIIENPGCMVFNADQNFSLNCSPRIIDVLFIQSHIPFTFKYADRSIVKRVDIFIPQKEAEKLLNLSLLNHIDEHDMISIKADSRNKMVEELLDTINKKLQGEHLCKYLHELIICLNEIGKWKSRF